MRYRKLVWVEIPNVLPPLCCSLSLAAFGTLSGGRWKYPNENLFCPFTKKGLLTSLCIFIWFGVVRWKGKVFWPPFVPCFSKDSSGSGVMWELCEAGSFWFLFCLIFSVLFAYWKRSSEGNWWCGIRNLLNLQRNSCSFLQCKKMPLKVSINFFYGYKVIRWQRKKTKLTGDKMERRLLQSNFLIAWFFLLYFKDLVGHSVSPTLGNWDGKSNLTRWM